MEYTIKFGLDIISKRNLISRKNGEIDLTVEADLEDLKRTDNEKVLKQMIHKDVQSKLKQKIFNIEILEINEKIIKHS